MLKFKLKRIGKKGQPYYRVVVTESTRNRSSRSVDDLGLYNPHTKPASFEIDTKKAKEWLEKGVKPTDTIAQYFVKLKLMKPVKKGSVASKGKTKKKQVEQKDN